MITPHTRFDALVFARRRDALARRLGTRPALFPAGAAPSRNYRATRYRFRASSHFLHLVGMPLERAWLHYDDGRYVLYAPEPTADDALWHGPSPTLSDLSAWTGLDVRSVSRLGALRDETACLPVRDLETSTHLLSLLGRVPTEPPTDARDVTLAHAMIASRLSHDDFAVGEIRHAIATTRRAFEAGIAETRGARTMREVKSAMLAVFEAHGDDAAYGPIVTTHGEILHTDDSSERVLETALVLADVGAESAFGYAADVTRTFPVRTASSTQADLLSLVMSAQKRAIATIAPGVRYRDVHIEAARTLAEGLVALGIFVGDPIERVMDGTIALLFPHGVGHLLGLDVHDMEDLGDLAGYGDGNVRDPSPTFRFLRLDRRLVEGMVVTVEPGLYFVPAVIDRDETRRTFADRVAFDVLDRFRDVRGIRIEDDVCVTEGGRVVLSSNVPYAFDPR